MTSKPHIIENNVWIAANVVVLREEGTIGGFVVIGAGSIVNRDIPLYSIAVGVPAKVKKRFLLKNIRDSSKY